MLYLKLYNLSKFALLKTLRYFNTIMTVYMIFTFIFNEKQIELFIHMNTLTVCDKPMYKMRQRLNTVTNIGLHKKKCFYDYMFFQRN